MKRDTAALAKQKYDLIIIGGGIFGICAAWDATLRGLSVVLIEKEDFAHGTSANHFKMVHGGIRYLQHGDIVRVRESCRERSALMRIAPHLVKPLPIVMPTYGHGMKGKEILSMGMLLYDLLTLDRNAKLPAENKIPFGKCLSKSKIIELFPDIKSKGLTGGALFYDGQIQNPPRLAMSFLRSAVKEGAAAANYLEVTDLLRENNQVTGVKVKDKLASVDFIIQGKVVLNAAGPWAHHLLKSTLNLKLTPTPIFSRDLAFVIPRRITGKFALACTTSSSDVDVFFDRGGRHLFIVPWRNYTLVGVWHKIFDEKPENIKVTSEELQDFVDEINIAYPGAKINRSEISMVNTGLTLFGEDEQQGSKTMSFGKRSYLFDHSKEDQLDGLITLIGVRATTARGMAEKAIDMVLIKLGVKKIRSKSAQIPIYGGKNFKNLLQTTQHQGQLSMLPNVVQNALFYNYGSEYINVLKYASNAPALLKNFINSTVLKAEIIHAIREEMAEKLADVVFRRTDFGTGAIPASSVIDECGTIMANEKGWDELQLKAEIDDVKAKFLQYLDSA